ncbi:transcription repressor NadR [Cytobacillus sp. S13-E01]|uniref:transcription repressor NadR n=1 Tax=Cytobacillus sp. S13-E01 TaxID=3031326 RepID=UPI0023D859F0|nr:transcription repressor NadR [Cytobacillus sp. S13-E01]MDF0726782.1 transcription repressor NadR [Cytobacillus sp. S13-E01]
MKDEKKILGESRRDLILEWLKDTREPMTGSELAAKTNVSRQVIVQDISLLKARNEPILATSQGYIYLNTESTSDTFERVVACYHTPGQTIDELTMIVDHGVTVKDVRIEHPVYGDLTASIMVSSRKEVDTFMTKIKETKSSYLSELTDGTHLHTLEANSTAKLDAACQSLKKAGFLLE